MPKHARNVAPRSRKLGRRIALTALAAGVAGSVPLIGFSSAANAADGTNWDAIAQCESSGNWSTNTGNGFSGGLQFTQSTWDAYGGQQYAGSANQASRDQQIAVAEKVAQGQGMGAWPVCGGNGGSSGTYSGTNTGGDQGDYNGYDNGAGDDQQQSGDNGQQDNGQQEQVAAHAKKSGPSYTIQAGDTLAKIAVAHGVQGGWQELAANNADVISDPNLIFTGQQIVLA